MNEREQRGLSIAAQLPIVRKGGVWIVPSQTLDKRRYTVCPHATEPVCTCADYEAHGQKCKHIYAVQFVMKRETAVDGTVTETKSVTVTAMRRSYPQDWSAYNRSQVTEKAQFQVLLHELCHSIAEPETTGPGRKRFPLRDAIFAAVFKVYSTMSGRRFISDLNDAHAKGYVNRVASYNSIFKVLETEATFDVLKSLVVESAKPLATLESTFACDSSGFSGSRFDKWFDHKFGQRRIVRAWVKAHIMCGTRTNVVTAIEIHGRDAADLAQLKPLLATTAESFTVKELSADMAYSSHDNLKAIVEHGAEALIPFKKSASGKTGGLWAKLFHYYNLNREEFDARYHRRSNVETTFSMVKSKFGDGVRSKVDVAMKNEVLAKFLCHNICCLIQSMNESSAWMQTLEVWRCSRSPSNAISRPRFGGAFSCAGG